MRFYVIISLVVICLYTSEAAGRKKIIDHKINFEVKSTQNVSDTEKPTDKYNFPKKATSLKKRPTKSPLQPQQNSTVVVSKKKPVKEVGEAFSNLPKDDLKFIMELDNQFKLHGGKLKIKVEHDNTTNAGKNSKRTIEGDLGYGYAHNGYKYERPKFMFYPYSQKDIPADAPSYYPQYETTSVTVEPSYSYELKPQTYLVTHTDTAPKIDIPVPNEEQRQIHSQNNFDDPVIVLRIPGPTKYASHLQALLQQYLEIRAAQYLRILEATEAQKQQLQQEERYEQQQPDSHNEQPSLDYDTMSYVHHGEPTPQPIMYPEIDDVYQTYKSHHYQNQQQAPEQTYQSQQSHGLQEEEAPQYYYPNEQQTHNDNRQVYVISMGPTGFSNNAQHQNHPQQPIYVPEEDHHHSSHLATSENNPRSTHTKIYFTQNIENGAKDHSTMYPLPSILPFERQSHPSAHYQEQYPPQATVDLDFQNEQSVHAESAPHQEIVAITQKPFNHHAHQVNLRSRKRATAQTMPSTTTTAPFSPALKSVDETEQHLQNIRKYVKEKLGAQTGSTIEFKSTKVVKG